MFDVGARLATPGQRVAKAKTVSERAKSVQANIGDDAFAAPFHHHRNRAATLHPVGALLV